MDEAGVHLHDPERDSVIYKMYGIEEKKKSEWDCETVLTTNSNISNHPGKINIRKLNKDLKEMMAAPKKQERMEAIAEGDEEEEEDEDDEDAQSDATVTSEKEQALEQSV